MLVQVLKEGSEPPPPGCAIAIIDDTTSVHLLLKGMVDPAAEIVKLTKKKEDTLK